MFLIKFADAPETLQPSYATCSTSARLLSAVMRRRALASHGPLKCSSFPEMNVRALLVVVTHKAPDTHLLKTMWEGHV
jgi:hypothetical protein